MASFSLKDQLFNPEKVNKVASELSEAFPDFNAARFSKTVLTKFPDLELKERMAWMTDCLYAELPKSFEDALAIILSALPAPCDPTLTDDDFGDFIYAPYGQFVARYGLDHDKGLSGIEALTTRFSCEEPIRVFINHNPKRTLATLKQWATHPHYHVRRLVSEGTRPLLPWAKKIDYQPDYTDLLDTLYTDSTRFVTRSVANHLNDVSKSNPEAVLKKLKAWKHEHKQQPKEMDFIIRHSLRTLIKKGHKGALEMLGYAKKISADIDLSLDKTAYAIGEAMTFTITVQPQVDEPIIVDYVITFQGKNGAKSQKVFKLKTLSLKKGKTEIIKKTYTFKMGMSTRTFYPGQHTIQIQVNGIGLNSHSFMLTR